MKNILILLLSLISFNVCSQTIPQIEIEISKDSILTNRYKNATEGCIKVQPRYVNKYKQNCPVFLDEQGYLFYICIIKQHLEYIVLDENVAID